MVMACCISASVAVGFDLVARDASCLVCHRRLESGDNSYDMVARLRLLECYLYDPLLNMIEIVGLCWLNLTSLCTRVLFCGGESSS